MGLRKMKGRGLKVRLKQLESGFDIKAKGLRLELGRRTHIMGILNVTPDSFSDGGAFFGRDKAIEHALAMAKDGADIIDVGGESTRPGASEVSADEELERVIPVIEGIVRSADVAVSIDTRKAVVADAAVKAGAKIINDVSGLRHDAKMASVAAKHGAGVVIMHSRGKPSDMQKKVVYKDVVRDVIAELKGSIEAATRAGVSRDAIIIDPGIGFAKTAEQSLEILSRLDEFRSLGRPVCIGVSRKSFLGKVLGGSDPDKRLAATIAACSIAVMKGANILRVHDVKESRDAAAVADSIARTKADR